MALTRCSSPRGHTPERARTCTRTRTGGDPQPSASPEGSTGDGDGDLEIPALHHGTGAPLGCTGRGSRSPGDMGLLLPCLQSRAEEGKTKPQPRTIHPQLCTHRAMEGTLQPQPAQAMAFGKKLHPNG